jgi:endonuclease/exonuclease/phosphatase family metal-dependent hydrolase
VALDVSGTGAIVRVRVRSPAVSTTLVSWNLKGSAGPDIGTVVGHLRDVGADVVGLQEVQRRQARRIARGLGATSWGWSFKHWPVRTWSEGMAVIGVTRRVRVRTQALSHPWRMWSWRRRIVQVADVDGADGVDGGFTLVNVHLTPHGEIGLRAVETATVLAVVARRSGPVVVCGDYNERPGGSIHGQLAEAGLRDAAGDAGPGDPAHTSIRGWRRGTTKAPSQRLDYVYVPAVVGVGAVRVPRPGDDGFERLTGLSDHLPVTAVLDVGGASTAG